MIQFSRLLVVLLLVGWFQSFGCGSLSAQQVLSGTVLDLNSEPVADASIEILLPPEAEDCQRLRPGISTMTDGEGKFQFTVPASAKRDDLSEMPGYLIEVRSPMAESGPAGRIFLNAADDLLGLSIDLPIRETVVLLHDNDMHFDFNAQDRFAARVTAFRKEFDNVWLLCGGDVVVRKPDAWERDGETFHGDSLWYRQEATTIIQTMNDIGYDVMTLGNHELAPIEAYTREALLLAKFPLLASNVSYDSEVLPPAVKQLAWHTNTGRRLGIVGLTVGKGDHLTIEKPIDAARNLVNLADDHDVFIALNHVGHATDLALAKNFPQFDVIIGAHSHTLLNPAPIVNGVLVAQAGGAPHKASSERPKYLGVITLEFIDGVLQEKRGEVLTFPASATAPTTSATSDDNAAVGTPGANGVADRTGQTLLVTSEESTSPAPPSEADLLFVRRVAPLLREKCLACHGEPEAAIEGGLDLRSPAGAFAGGDSGVAGIDLNAPEKSPLLLAVMRHEEEFSAMPPKESERLSEQQIDWLRQWLVLGADWPDESRQSQIRQLYMDRWSVQDGVTVVTSGGLSPAWTERTYDPAGLWAYQPVGRPKVHQTGPAAIDELLALHRPEGLEVAPDALAGQLIRRLSFGLRGLPPQPWEVADFETAYRSDPDAAVEEWVERLLDSPHYGERMAQHWLDVARYADSSGFANDYQRGNAWRYRDYVVRSFQQDRPYDQFIRQQIAGDEIAADDPENLIATGFLRMGPWELTSMEVAKVARQRFLDDVTNSVGETFLAHSLECARCHDHKFDPVPTQDYYAIQAVFATTQLAEREAEFLKGERLEGFQEQRFLLQRREHYQAVLRDLDAVLLENAQHWFREHDKDSAQWNRIVRQCTDSTSVRIGRVFARARNALQKLGVDQQDYPPKLVGFSPQQFGMERVARKGLERLAWELERYQPYALAVYSGRTPQRRSVTAPQRVPEDRLENGELESTCILAGGDPFAPTKPVAPGVLSVLSNQLQVEIPDTIGGRRLALARWIADERNPLTTRALVNRVWMWHFGIPIAGNPNNFGSTGKRPTHPELLDWLAAEFVDSGWSIKHLHRLILNSKAYRRSTQHPRRDVLARLDPAGQAYAVFLPRRLTAEEIRDAMLAASGELNRRVGGIPNRPEIHLEVAMQPRQVMGTFAAAWTPNPLPEQRHRRSLYALKIRGLTNPTLEVFNAPGPDFSCERREVSTVTPQVFQLFNSQSVYQRALAVAHRVLRSEETDQAATAVSNFEAVRECFLLTLGRQPSLDELEACQNHWQAMTKRHRTIDVRLVGQPRSVVRQAVEENTGEKFQFEETLAENTTFVPDLQPADCDARTRGLAEVCLVLLNTNEFVYVY